MNCLLEIECTDVKVKQPLYSAGVMHVGKILGFDDIAQDDEKASCRFVVDY